MLDATAALVYHWLQKHEIPDNSLGGPPRVFADQDKWIRHRLRALQLKQWKRGSTIYPALRRVGLSQLAAAQAAGVNQRWWHRAAQRVQLGLTTRYYQRLGVPRLAE